MKYGKDYLEIITDQIGDYRVLDKDMVNQKEANEIIKDALNNPIGSKKLKDIVKSGDKVCLVISDITRHCQRMDIFLPFIIQELNCGGVEDKDIVILSATGAHEKQTEEEHRLLLGEALAKRFQVIDHDCHDKGSLKSFGITRYGTPIEINRYATECDHLILTGAVTYHDMAGYGGGRKSLLPGIASYEAIFLNHMRVFGEKKGSAINPECRLGNLNGNPMHEDMMDACDKIKPSFIFNIILNSEGNYYKAVAGNYREAFERGVQYCDEVGAVHIDKKADVVIASAGGYPKDINLYQASKAHSVGIEALKAGGTLIILAQCPDNMGSDESVDIIMNYDTNEQRERFMRKAFIPEAYSGYLICEISSKYDVIFVSDYQDQKVIEK
ncbi:nickel-dependent lactate racemase, partial [Clostridium sp.]|uniref:nickel-dependent lactate racemase n=1 Tax=Clostridium sp. TaxID=1506 RepID=UPI001A4D919F